MTHTTTTAGCPGTGVLKAALPGSRITALDASGISILIVKGDNGKWGFGAIIAGVETLPTSFASEAAGVEWYCFKHGHDFDSITFTGERVEVASLPTDACRRCSGRGIVEQYRHINGGTCFDCGGDGKRRR